METLVQTTIKNLMETIETTNMRGLKRGDKFKMFYSSDKDLKLEYHTHTLIASIGDFVDVSEINLDKDFIKLHGSFYEVVDYRIDRGDEAEFIYIIKSLTTGLILKDIISEDFILANQTQLNLIRAFINKSEET